MVGVRVLEVVAFDTGRQPPAGTHLSQLIMG